MSKLKDGNYRTVLRHTTTNSVEGIIPKIGKIKLLEKLKKHKITESDVDKTEVKHDDGTVGYWIPLPDVAGSFLGTARVALDVQELKKKPKN